MKTKYGIEFVTKREFVKWIEEHLNEIDFDEDVITLHRYDSRASRLHGKDWNAPRS